MSKPFVVGRLYQWNPRGNPFAYADPYVTFKATRKSDDGTYGVVVYTSNGHFEIGSTWKASDPKCYTEITEEELLILKMS